ncbi:MAG: methionyl-tRNA formyltransferase, partial [Desulfofustis sp.]|nr:methionyl-tRNA formyltransferase [Desulfofustis sp.]
MRIVFIGQAAFGAEALEALLTQGEQVAGVITTEDSPRQNQTNPVKDVADRHSLSVLQSNRLKRPEAVSWVRRLQPDLLVLAFVTSFVPQEMIDCARHGGINYHPSLLPQYRGGSAINWAVINGETETGVTIHFIDQGVDTGPILLQEKVAIAADDTVKSLYFGKLYPLGITMLCEAVRQIRTGTARAVPQDEAKASFQPVITAADTVIDWQQPTESVYNLIRGSNPSPGASSCLHGTLCRIFDVAVAESGKGAGQFIPGTVRAVDAASFTVATGDGGIVVQTIQTAGTRKT